MTAVEAIEELNNIEKGDTELAHGEADDILLALLRSQGNGEVAKAWIAACERVGGFWYA